MFRLKTACLVVFMSLLAPVSQPLAYCCMGLIMSLRCLLQKSVVRKPGSCTHIHLRRWPLTALWPWAHRLDLLESDKMEARAASLLHGLGFTKEMQAKKTRDFSGGWRMRIALARALFTPTDLLLLGKPRVPVDNSSS